MTRRLLVVLLSVLTLSARAAGQSYEVVHRAPGNGSGTVMPFGRLVAAQDGTLYGTTLAGGDFAYGSIMRFVPDGAGGFTRSDVHSFTGADGSSPQGSLALGADGFLYGATLRGGAADAGTLFRVDPAGRLTVLHDFASGPGRIPSPVVVAPNGSLYGTTASAGLYNQGTLYRFDSPGGLTTLHDFGNNEDGARPGGVVVGGDGSLWGTTQIGGANGSGTVFRMDASGYATLHSFTGSSADGFSPNASLVEAGGFLYGTTTAGIVAFPVFGTLFRIDPAGSLTTLHVFDTATGGAPIDGFARGTDGNLYADTRQGSDPPPPGGAPQNQYDPVFYRVDASGVFTVLHIFPPGSSLPFFAGPVAAPDGNFYAMGLVLSAPVGNLLRYQISGAVESVYDTPPDFGYEGSAILSPLYEAADGSLYGASSGRAFLKIDPDGNQSIFHLLLDFSNPADDGLIGGSDGNFYATLQGAPGRFVRLDPAGELTNLYDFEFDVTGGVPFGVIQAPDGDFYGAAALGGANGHGTVFRLTDDGGSESLHDFDGTDGDLPAGELLLASDGNLYGTTQHGGDNNLGTLFRYESGVGLTAIHHFAGDEGEWPKGRLIQAPDGYLYGTTNFGGVNNFGTIFRSDLAGNVTKVFDATSSLSRNVVARADSFLYAAYPTQVFKVDGQGSATPVHDFLAPENCLLNGLRLAANGDLLGTTQEDSTAGSVFRISDVAAPPEIAGLNPTSGPASGGASVRIGGHHFRDGITATFGGAAAEALQLQGEALLAAVAPPLEPGTLHDVAVDEAAGAAALVGAWFSDFLDVSGAHPFHDYVESVFRHGITAGCGGGNYCPASPVTRAQMAVFLLKAEHGSAYLPPACTGAFGDVPCPSLFADWIERLAAEGITAGCGGGDYCPDSPVTRAQMAVFLLKTEHGQGYAPPECAGQFADVPCPSLFADWVEQLAAEGVTAGCGGGNYCPLSPNSRGQMAVFLTKTFDFGP